MDHVIPNEESPPKHNGNKRKSSLLRRTDWLGPDGNLYDRSQQQQALRDAYYRSKQQAEISESQSRVVSVFRRFLRRCCSRERPLVLFMDDLQWADEFSLATLAGRLYETKEESHNSGLLFLATCRGNEVSLNDHLSVVLRQLEDLGTPITDIRVDNLSFDGMNDMISNFLHLPRAECLPLVEVVYNQTQGNAFFSIQFLRSLEEEGVLYKDRNKGGRWTWKAEELMVSLEGTGNDDLIVQLLANKMKELPPDVLEVVKAASCLGNDFTEEVLCNSGAATPQQVLDALDDAEDEGVLVYDFDTGGGGHFSHDKFKEAAYSLIPDDQKASFHLQIARTLRQQLTPTASKKYVSVILNQLKMGMDELKDPSEREECAFICLKAARKAGKAASFVAASEYAELGMRLLERRHWRDQYTLSLSLFNSAAELNYCSGKHMRVHELVKDVLENARSSDDKLQAHIVKILTLQAETNTRAAITYCVEVLRRLGEPFPRNPNFSKIAYGYLKTKRKLANISDEDIMNLPPLTDTKASTAMVFIHQLFPLVQQERFEYTPLIAFRLVHLTLKHGLSAISSAAFSVLGVVLTRIGHPDEGYRYVKLSFRILEKYPSDAWMTRCITLSCGAALPAKEPLRDPIPLSLTGHRMGLKSGELEAGLIAGVINSILRIMVGDPLPKITKGLLQLVHLSHDYNQGVVVNMSLGIHQLSLNLQGKAKDPLKLTGELVDEDVMLEEVKREKRTMILVSAAYMKHMLAFYADKYDFAVSFARQHKKAFAAHQNPLSIFLPIHLFHTGLIAASLAWHNKRKLSVARKNLKTLKAMVMDCPENTIHKAYLLEAEILAFEGRHDAAMCKYTDSIKYAEKAGYVNEQAVANEKAGCMLRRRGLGDQALPFTKEARDLYSRWGSELKVQKMDSIIAELQVNGHGGN